jgi:hypothetical protein
MFYEYLVLWLYLIICDVCILFLVTCLDADDFQPRDVKAPAPGQWQGEDEEATVSILIPHYRLHCFNLLCHTVTLCEHQFFRTGKLSHSLRTVSSLDTST